MKTKRIRVISVLSILLLLILSFGMGCSSNDTEKEASSEQKPAKSEEKPAAPEKKEVKRYVLAGASEGGNGHTFVAIAANLFNKYIDGVEFSARPGSNLENINAFESGEALGGQTNPSALKSLRGQDGKTTVKTLWIMFDGPLTIVVPKDSPINSYSDLKGMRVSVGKKGAGEDQMNSRIFEALGIDKEKYFKQIQYLGKGAALPALKDGAIDAALVSSPHPGASFIVDMAASPKGAKLISLTDEEQDKIVKKFPQYSKSTIPAGSYDFQKEDMKTTTEYYYLAVSGDAPEDLVYEMAKVLHEKQDELRASAPWTSTATVENTVKNPGFELHPGAVKYFKEIGALK